MVPLTRRAGSEDELIAITIIGYNCGAVGHIMVYNGVCMMVTIVNYDGGDTSDAHELQY